MQKTLMTKAFKLYFICFTAAAFVLLSCSPGAEPNLQGNVYPAGNGFGYTIKANGKLLIKQSIIPAVEGNHPFCDSIDAAKVCDKVMEKIKQRKAPYITPEELKQLKIKTKC